MNKDTASLLFGDLTNAGFVSSSKSAVVSASYLSSTEKRVHSIYGIQHSYHIIRYMLIICRTSFESLW